MKKRKIKSQRPKTTLGKVWYFIWEDDSIWSWLVNIIIAFILIKYIVYPGLGLVLGTTHPIVAVVSSSMEHDGSFDEWWQSDAQCGNKKCSQEQWYFSYNITKQLFQEFKFKNGFNAGDIIILTSPDPSKVKVGDVIVFKSRRPDPIIHRTIRKWEENSNTYFQTKGDHNMLSISSSSLDETRISEELLIGKSFIRVPYLGWVKIGFIKLLELFGI